VRQTSSGHGRLECAPHDASCRYGRSPAGHDELTVERLPLLVNSISYEVGTGRITGRRRAAVGSAGEEGDRLRYPVNVPEFSVNRQHC